MTEPLQPSSDVTVDHTVGRPAWSDVAPHSHAVEPMAASAPPGALDHGRRSWRADRGPALTLLRHTLSIGALASGLIEYIGWQLVQRVGDSSTVIPLGEWALGMARNLGGAAGVGLGVACVAMLVPSFRKRPLRAASAAFAFGVAGFLAFLSFLLSLAP